MSECRAYRHEIVEAWDGGELSRGARAHVRSCRACGEELRGRERLRALVGGLGKVEAPADFEFRLRARMAASKGAGGQRPLRGLRLLYAFAPVAAAACFLVISATLYLRQPSKTRPADAPRAAAAVPAPSERIAQVPPASGRDESTETKPTGGSALAEATSSINLASRAAAHRPRAAARQTREDREVAAVTEEGARLTPNTSIASFGSAPIITGRNVTIALKTPPEPLRMILRDERGAGRVVPVRAVSFGSQELIAREGVLRQTVAAEDEGVW